MNAQVQQAPTISSAYRGGHLTRVLYAAGGYTNIDNPYCPEDPRHAEWEAGYKEAHAVRECAIDMLCILKNRPYIGGHEGRAWNDRIASILEKIGSAA